jgi:hypothetical protein
MKNKLMSIAVVLTFATILMLTYFYPQISILSLIIGFIVSTGFITHENWLLKILSFIEGSILMYVYFNQDYLYINVIFGIVLILLGLIVLFIKDKPSGDDEKILYIDDGDTLKTVIAYGQIKRTHQTPEILFVFDEHVTLNVICKKHICKVGLTDKGLNIKEEDLTETIIRVRNFVLAVLENHTIVDELNLISKAGDKI